MLTMAEADALFARRRDAWLREDLEAYLACWAEDMTFVSPVHQEPVRGRDAYAALIRSSATAVRPLRFDVTHLAVRDDVVLAEWEIEAEHRASGSRLRWRGMSVAGYRDGLIVWWREYWNPAALGLGGATNRVTS
jgi:ketosteroid isomerase-like protein